MAIVWTEKGKAYLEQVSELLNQQYGTRYSSDDIASAQLLLKDSESIYLSLPTAVVKAQRGDHWLEDSQ